MKKFLSFIMAILFVVFGATTVQAATTVDDIENALKSISVPSQEASIIANYLHRANIADDKIDALVEEATEIFNIVGDSTLHELDGETKLVVASKVKEAAHSIGLEVKIDTVKIVVTENGEKLFSLFTDQLEEVKYSLDVETLKELGAMAKELNDTITSTPESTPVIPSAIQSVINHNIVTVLSGNGTKEAPLVMEIKEDVKVSEIENMFSEFEGEGYKIKAEKLLTRSTTSYLVTLTNSSETLYLSFIVSNENNEMINYFEGLVKTTNPGNNANGNNGNGNNANGNNGNGNNGNGNNANGNNTTNGTTATTPNQLNQTGFNSMLLVAGIAVATLGASLFVISRKLNA